MLRRKLTAMISLLIIPFINTWALMPDSNYRQLSDFPFVIVSDESVFSTPVITDSLFDAASMGIRFQVNSSELQPTDPFISLYNNKLLPWLQSQDMELRKVFVRGAASPDGPYETNVRLSRERTNRLIEFISKGLGQTIGKRPIQSSSITEDYSQLVKLMKQANDTDYERVNTIWQSCNGDEACCKKMLMALDDGEVWQRLKSEYFPTLRQARVILWFAHKRTAVIKPLQLKHDFALLLPSTLNVNIQEPEKCEYTRRHLIAARTNLVHDLLYVPQFGLAWGGNIQLEYYPRRGHLTYNVGFTFINHRHWSDYKFFQMRDLQLELRRYFKGGGTFKGAYLGLYGEGNTYGIGFGRDKGWEGEGGGGGLSLGYTWRLNRKGNLRMELSASAGIYITRYDPYVYGNPVTGIDDNRYYYDYTGDTSEFKERNYKFTWLGPTNAGIHLTYDIIYRKKQPVGSYKQKGGGL